MENKINYAKKHPSTRLLNEVDGVQRLFTLVIPTMA